jgi:prolyl oligopeptidase PreP (S9A serine peptidase family)
VLEGRAGSDLVHCKAVSFAEPGAIWSHHLVTGERKLVHRPPPAFDPDEFCTEQVFVDSGWCRDTR